VLVLGGGPIGLAVLQCLKAKGVAAVIVAEVARQRQIFARDFGADYVLDPTKDDVVALSKKYSFGDKGPDVVFDCAGVPASIKTACQAVKARGWVVNVAIWEKEVPFNPNWLVFKEAKYTACLGYQKKDFEAVLENLKEGKLKPERMITSKIRMENVVEDGILALSRDKDKHVKILVEVGAK
jgi:threonine dehydrogenase-like Zn-dependent dehydrogenase